jgi:hypothetical protein
VLHKRKIGAWCLAALLSVSGGATLLAWDYVHWYVDIYGNNDPNAGDFGLQGGGYIQADPEWAGGGPTYIQGWFPGFSTASCTMGSKAGDYCQDSGHNDITDWWSEVGNRVSIVPFGTYQYNTEGWVNGEYKGVHAAIRGFDAPPDLPGDGYCVSYYYDGGGGGIRNSQYPDWACNESPILIAIGKDRSYRLSKTSPVLFDINADGSKEYLNWTRADSEDAFLAIDRNGNGRIDDGSELFGSYTVPGVRDGFSALRVLSGVTNSGEVNASSPFFGQLLLWTDRNHDGESQPDELQPASNVLEAVGLGYTYSNRRDGDGNAFRYRGWARRVNEDGKRVHPHLREFDIYDVILALAK